VAVALIIFIVAGSIGAVVILSKKNPSSPPIAHTTKVVNGTANVDAGAYVDYQFILPPNSSNIHVSGTFAVQGGSGIMVYIFDSTNFNTYETGGDFGGLYQSGQTTAALISSNLDSNGTYYLVLDNTLSKIAQTVNIEANVTYYTP
jgi:hypothetical protein